MHLQIFITHFESFLVILNFTQNTSTFNSFFGYMNNLIIFFRFEDVIIQRVLHAYEPTAAVMSKKSLLYTRSTFLLHPGSKFPKSHAKMGLLALLKF